MHAKCWLHTMTLLAILSSFSSNFPYNPCSRYAQYILMLKSLCCHRRHEWWRREALMSLLSALPFCHSISDHHKDLKDVFSDIFEHDWAIMVCQSIPLCSWNYFVWKVSVSGSHQEISSSDTCSGGELALYMAYVQTYVWWFRQENVLGFLYMYIYIFLFFLNACTMPTCAYTSAAIVQVWWD